MRIGLVSDVEQASLIDLLCELHSYYHEGSIISAKQVEEHLLENLLAAESPHQLVVAVSDEGDVLGLAAITEVFSFVDFATEHRKQCQLKELYVRSSARGKGVGGALMCWLAGYALKNGCHRIDWPVKATNTRGIAFYESLGAEQVVERLSYRLSEPELSRLADLTTKGNS